MVMIPTPDTVITDNCVPAPSARQSHVRLSAGPRWKQVIRRWIERSRQRRVLATLDDRALADIGINRSEAARESAKPFWR